MPNIHGSRAEQSPRTRIGPIRRTILIGLALLSVASNGALAEIIDASPENYRNLLSALQPGDTLRLAAGEYRRGLPVYRLEGTRDAPIVVEGPAQGEPAVFIARTGANTVSIVESAHVEVRNLTLDGRGIPVDAVKAEGHSRWAHHITLENLAIVNHGASQQNVGISTKCPAWGWVIRGNSIHGAGTGMYLGNSDGTRPFYDGLIENNLVTDPRGYAIQIKHQHARPSLDIAPLGRYVTIIRHNVLSKANGGSVGPDARPNLLLGHWPLAGEGSADEYLVYGNYLADNPHEALFQGEGNIAFYNNVLRNRHGPGVLLYNTIITRGDPVVVRSNEATNKNLQIVARNAVFSLHPLTGGVQAENRSYSWDDAAMLLSSAPQDDVLDPYPRDNRLHCPAPDKPALAGLVDAGCDFNGTRRTNHYCGAYAGHGRNPGWLPAPAIKPRTICRAR